MISPPVRRPIFTRVIHSVAKVSLESSLPERGASDVSTRETPTIIDDGTLLTESSKLQNHSNA